MMFGYRKRQSLLCNQGHGSHILFMFSRTALFCFFGASAATLPFWKWVAHTYDTRTAWLAGWILHIPTTFFLLFLGEGNTTWFLFLTTLTGASYGSMYLCKAMLSDVIDYDEVV